MTFILVIFTVVIIISFELLRKSHSRKLSRAPEMVMEHPSTIQVTDRHFHPAHTWVLVTEGRAEVTVGVDDFSPSLLGTITSLRLPHAGQSTQQGEPFAELRHGNRVLPQAAPVSGVVVSVNQELETHPTLLNESPLDRGWLVTIRPSHLFQDIRNLLNDASAEAWRAALRTRLVQMFSPKIGTVLQDGGALVNNIGDHISDEVWNLLVKEFFTCESDHLSQNNNPN